MKRLSVLALALVCIISARSLAAENRAFAPPNVIIIMTDDQGYNDLGCYGSPVIKTPRIDRMAAEGTRFTDWYAPAPVCTPTRAALLTGCYPPRVSLRWIPKERPNGEDAHVLYARSRHGLNPSEITVAEILHDRGYATECIGKWHLGDAKPFLPTRQGFDKFLGTPYSNDMLPAVLMRDEKVIEQPMDQDSLIERYTDEATSFIKENKARPFFLYFAHNMPHVPLHVSDRFRGKSAGGLYGDCIEAIDWSVGQVLDTLRELNLDANTLVFYTSDNGPWYMKSEDGGSATPLRGGKGTTYEGGMRMPFIARWRGHVPANRVSHEVLSHIDLMPTIVALAGGQVPTDRIIDGKDVSPILFGQPDAKNPHEYFLYFGDNSLNAIRSGKWKLKFEGTLREETYYTKYEQPDAKIPPALYNLELDPGEQKDVAPNHPDIVKHLSELADAARQDLGDARREIVGKNVRPRGEVDYDPREIARKRAAATRAATRAAAPDGGTQKQSQ